MTTITQSQINRGTNKETGEVFYSIKSDSQENVWYAQTWNDASMAWECNCASRKPCKHLRAVQEVLKSKKSECRDSRYDLPLNGNRGFSLMR